MSIHYVFCCSANKSTCFCSTKPSSHHITSHHITSHHTVWNITQEKSTLQHCLCLFLFFSFSYCRPWTSFMVNPSSIRVDCHMPIIYLAPQREKTSTTAFFTLYSLNQYPSQYQYLREQNLFICCDHSFLFDILLLFLKSLRRHDKEW